MESPLNVAVAVAFDHGRKRFLLLKRSEDRERFPGKWEFSSGEIEDEEPRNAALRELEEETGLKGTHLKTGEAFTVQTGEGFFRIHPFLVKVEGEQELSREHEKFEWIKPEELEEFDTVQGLREDLERVGAVE